ncbi:hypothetical protein H7X46_17885 [Pseudonocardia sp. C8]|uniref:hypothetical protein n=1 Tax=Pseudonocardia sp. C8 TaxID=2762759 RepID=UPI0016432A64|nr:hypothetical protein [Pseudonocardia sp. C8]MBC3192932.1 hypothetical protein [Pseudonocardia sp. C8]
MSEHHHAHGPANRGRVVHTTSAPLFVTGDERAPGGAVVIVHGEPGIDAELEARARATAAGGSLVVVPYLYFRDGGPDYPHPDRAAAAYAGLDPADVDADVDGAVDHLTGRLGIVPAAIRLAGAGAGMPAAARAADRLGLPGPDLVDGHHHLTPR